MKKFILATIIGMSMIGSAVANDRHYRPYHRPHVQHHHHGHRWVAPLIIGGAIGYGVTRYYGPPAVYSDAPVVVHQPPVVVAPQCTRYIYQDSYGNTIREETRCE